MAMAMGMGMGMGMAITGIMVRKKTEVILVG